MEQKKEPLLLGFQLTDTETPFIAALAKEQGLIYTAVPAEQWNRTFSMLCGETAADAPAYAGEALSESMLVFAYCTDAQIQSFLGTCKKRGIRIPALLALLTETNAGWTPTQLCRQLAIEREAFKMKMKELHEESGEHHHEHHHHE